MKKTDAVGRIERVETLFAELKEMAHRNREYWTYQHHELWETVALMNRYRRSVAILAELIGIVSVMYREKSDTRKRSLPKRKRRRRSFLRMAPWY